MKLMMFAKHLQSYPLEKAGQVAKELGFDGLQLTVREGGFVAPEDVKEHLPAAMATLERVGAEVPLIATDITAADDDYAEETFAAAAKCGIKALNLGYLLIFVNIPFSRQL